MLQGRRGTLIAIAAVVAVVVLLVLFLVLPKMGQVSDGQDELAAAQGQQGTLESQLVALGQAEAAAPEAEETIREVDTLIPPTADPSGFLLLTKNAAAASGVTLTTLTPGVPVLDAATGLSTISLSLEATGSYFSLTEFLYSIETLPRAATVQSIQMSPEGTETGTSPSSLRLVANLELYTTDANAGPGSDPGETTAEPSAAPATGSIPETGGAT